MAKKAESENPPLTTKEKWKRFFKEWVLTLGIAFAVAFLFRTTIASPRHIPTGSMIPTIKIGEFIFVSMFAYDWHIPFTRKSFKERHDPQRGDIVVFEYPLDPSKDYIKRVIGVPGDTIEIRNKRVILNGKPLPTEVVNDPDLLADLAPKYDPSNLTLLKETIGDVSHYIMHMNDRNSGDMEPTIVPEDSFFVMGDNRDDSLDSRYWGFVPRRKILGEGSFIWFSFDKDHFPWLRGSRFFTWLR